MTAETITPGKSFKCPRCGGSFFGTSCEVDADGRFVRISRYECHSSADGGPVPDLMTQALNGQRVKGCGWKGTAEACFTTEPL